MSVVEVVFQSAVHMSGVGKKTNRPFDFAELRYLSPISPVSMENFQLQGYGMEQSSIPLETTSLIHQFSNCQPGELISIEVGASPRDLNKNVCRGLVKGDSK